MKRWFLRLPIRQKLVTMILATSGVVVTLASVGHFVNDYRVTRAAAVEELSAHAQLLLESAAWKAHESLYSLGPMHAVGMTQ